MIPSLNSVSQISTPIALGALAILVLAGVFKLLIRGPLRKPLGKTHTFKIINRIVTLVFVLAMVVVLLAFGVTILTRPRDMSQQFHAIMSWTNELNGDVRGARAALHQELNPPKSNLRDLGFNGSRVEFLTRMAMAFHEDLDSPTAFEDKLAYALAACAAPVESARDGLFRGIAATIVASAALFGQINPDYDRAGSAIEDAERHLDSCPTELRTEQWKRYRTLTLDYRIEYLLLKPSPNQHEGIRLCSEGLQDAVRDEDMFALKRLVYRGLKWADLAIRGNYLAGKPPDPSWAALLEESLNAFEEHVTKAGVPATAVSDRTAYAYLVALELSMWPQMRLARWNGDKETALGQLEGALHLYERRAESWGRLASLPENGILVRASRINWYCRLLVLSSPETRRAEVRNAWWSEVEGMLRSLSDNRQAARILIEPGPLFELKEQDPTLDARIEPYLQMFRGMATTPVF